MTEESSLLREPINDEEVANGYQVEKELNALLRKATLEEDAVRPGRAAANEVDRSERRRTEHREREERERLRWGWVNYHEAQRRVHLELALEHRAKSRELRGVA